MKTGEPVVKPRYSHAWVYSDGFAYVEDKEYDDEGNIYGVCAPDAKKAIARCLRHEAQHDWYGLMSSDSKIIAPPIYKDIEALGLDLYLCKDASYDGTLINSDGQLVR